MKCKEIITAIENIAPPFLKESWDHTGLMIGNQMQEIHKVLFAVDLNPEIVEEAILQQYTMIVTHHPFFFDPIHAIDASTWQGKMIYRMIQHEICLYSCHTNYDQAEVGISEAMATLLQLRNQKKLMPVDLSDYKLVFYVPAQQKQKVVEHLVKIGARTYRSRTEYVQSSQAEDFGFSIKEITRPAFVFQEDVSRVELYLPQSGWQFIVEELKRIHPHQEIVYDVYESKDVARHLGLGTIGFLPENLPLGQLAHNIKNLLQLPFVHVTGDPDKMISVVAVCGGSGKSLVDQSASSGAHVLITGDIDYHTALNAEEKGISLIDATHFATEKPGMQMLCQTIGQTLNMTCDFSKKSKDVFRIIE